MHIVHVANYYAPHSGGMRTTMHHLGAGYRAAGHDYTMVIPGPGHRVEETPFGTRISLPSVPLPGTGYSVIPSSHPVRRVLLDVGADHLEVSDRTTLRRLGGWAHDHGIPSVLFAHERLDHWIRRFTTLPPHDFDERRARIADRMNRTSLADYDRIVATTDYAARQFERLAPGTVDHIPLGADVDAFSPAHRSADVRARFVGDDEVLLVHVGRLSPEKSPEIAVDALRVLRSRGLPARLVIAGDGSSRARLERRAADLPVSFLGFLHGRSQVARLLASADVSLNPGPIETFCLSAVEALASGTPVVAARSSALGEIVADGAGEVSDPTPESFADGVERVLARPEAERRRAAAERGSTFRWERTVELMLALHADIGRPTAAA